MIETREEILSILSAAPKKRLLVMEDAERWSIRELQAFRHNHDDGGPVNLMAENALGYVAPEIARETADNDLDGGLWCSTFVLPSGERKKSEIEDELPF